MFRRVLLAVLISASMTLSGVSGCSDSTGPCDGAGEWCAPKSCCSGLHCIYRPNIDNVANCQPIEYPINVEGVVTDAATGEPIVGLNVSLTEYKEGDQVSYLVAWAVTDVDGFYSISTGLPCDPNSDESVGYVKPSGSPRDTRTFIYCIEEVQVRDFAVTRNQ